jgi:hypothetical protein
VNFYQKTQNPVITCQLDDRISYLELFPLKEVATGLGFCYFNNTVAYAVAYAIWSKVKTLCLYGIDYTYKNVSMAESGRACVEFWCGDSRIQRNKNRGGSQLNTFGHKCSRQ